MNDLFYLGVAVVFFALCGAFTRACEALRRS